MSGSPGFCSCHIDEPLQPVRFFDEFPEARAAEDLPLESDERYDEAAHQLRLECVFAELHLFVSDDIDLIDAKPPEPGLLGNNWQLNDGLECEIHNRINKQVAVEHINYLPIQRKVICENF